METLDYVSLLSSDGTRLGRLAADHMDSAVPGCPGWTVADLVSHLAGIYRWVGRILAAGGGPPGEETTTAPTEPAALLQWLAEAHLAVVQGLGARAAEDPAWTFLKGGPQTVGWWRRRQALETRLHLYDVEAAAGSVTSIDPTLAADGVDEYLSIFLARALRRGSVARLRGTLHLHATDTPGEWWLDLDDENAPPRLEHAKADTAVRGPAAGLLLWLWNRVGAEEAGLEIFGNAEVAAGFAELRA
jgi:uncharacterized protein (TIGR03083 family)